MMAVRAVENLGVLRRLKRRRFRRLKRRRDRWDEGLDDENM